MRRVEKSKVWRLTKKGRDLMCVDRRPVPLNSMSVDHMLSVGDAYLKLQELGGLSYFMTELREEFLSGGKLKKFSPDAFFVFKGYAYLLEVQLSPLSSRRWSEKWAVAQEFYNHHLSRASWQIVKGKIIRPRIIVLSNQSKEVITTGCHLPIITLRNTQIFEKELFPIC